MRVFREAMKCVHGRVVLLSITQPGQFDNETYGKRLRALDGRIRAQMWREGLKPPRCVAWVLQLQRRGAWHTHRVLLARSPDERARVVRYVELYRVHMADFALGWIDDPFRHRHPRRGGRPDRSRPTYTMEFASAERAAGYLSGYLGGGQFLELLAEGGPAAGLGRRARPMWVSPVLLARSGWNLARCRWVRQGWLIANGQWRLHRPEWDRRSFPSWRYRPGDRAWVEAQLTPA